MSKKLNKADFRFKQLSDKDLVKRPGEINGIDFLLSKLNNCTVHLCDHIAAVAAAY
jgi:protein XRP2